MDLKQTYRRALGARSDALAGALALLPGEPAEASASIRRIAHSLRGSGATYGFPEVSRAAAAVEESDAAELAAHAAELLALLRGLAEEAGAQRVLVVDDDPEMQLLLGHVLAGPGVEVTAATTAAEARARLAAERFDLIVLDLLLPDADGRQVLLAIRDDHGNAATPVFVLSAKTGTHARTESFALGANGFFEKPFEPETLAAAVAAELRRGRMGAMPPTAATGRARNVLIVEDDELVAAIVKHRLDREGFGIHHYTNGSAALEALDTTEFVLAILDVKVPGLDGFQLLERLRARPATAKLPVIMLTALGGERDVVRGLDLGADDYVIKPFSPVELIARVHRLLSI